MAKNTAEYDTIIQHFPAIASIIESDLTQISSELICMGLINQRQGRAARSSSTPTEYRAAELVDTLLTKIQQDSINSVYYKFVELLKKGQTYEDIVRRLDDTLRLKKGSLEQAAQFQPGTIHNVMLLSMQLQINIVFCRPK
jgi:hypothetical protein